MTLTFATVLVVGACTPNNASIASPTAQPGASRAPTGQAATPPIPGLSWIRAAEVARPDDAFEGGSAPTTGPGGPDTAGHPGHFPGQAIVDDVVASPNGFVAVGYVGLRGMWTARAWTSTDGETWALSRIDDAVGSFAVSIAVGSAGAATGRIVAAGRSGPEPAVWTSSDGRAWLRQPVTTLGGAEPERIGTVLATDAGLVAGGSSGPELGDRHARFWGSVDGTTWEPVPDDPAFEGAEVVDITTQAGGYVAVGRLGTGQRGTGSVAWTSRDGVTWTRSEAPSLGSGLVASVGAAPDGSLVAVGSDLDEREALVWRSSDGATWDLVPSEDSRLYNGDKIRMTDVALLPGGGFVAVGNYVGVQYGTATSWTSSDGTTWRRAPGYPALEQGEMLAVAIGTSEVIAVGSYGAPDNYIPTIWRSPLKGGG